MFIAVFADIFRRNDLSGWGKAGWILLVFIVPFLGILIYVIARPKMTEQDKEILMKAQEQQRRAAGYSAADEIAKLSGAQGEWRHHHRRVRDDEAAGARRRLAQTPQTRRPGA